MRHSAPEDIGTDGCARGHSGAWDGAGGQCWRGFKMWSWAGGGRLGAQGQAVGKHCGQALGQMDDAELRWPWGWPWGSHHGGWQGRGHATAPNQEQGWPGGLAAASVCLGTCVGMVKVRWGRRLWVWVSRAKLLLGWGSTQGPHLKAAPLGRGWPQTWPPCGVGWKPSPHHKQQPWLCWPWTGPEPGI